MFPGNTGRPLPGRCRSPKAGSGLGREDPTSDLDWYHGSRVAQGDSSLVPAIEVGLVGVVGCSRMLVRGSRASTGEQRICSGTSPAQLVERWTGARPDRWVAEESYKLGGVTGSSLASAGTS